MKTFFDRINFAVKNWWLSLIIGILFVGLGILLMFTPLQSYIALSIVFSVTMFISGVFEISFAVSNRKNLSSWGWYLASGIIDLLIGLYLMYYPAMSMAVLPFLVAFWLMFRGFAGIGYAIDLQRYGTRDWGWYLVFGILAILCAVAVLWQPVVGALSVVYIVAFAFLFIGMFRIMLSFELKRLHGNNKALHEEVENLYDDGVHNRAQY